MFIKLALFCVFWLCPFLMFAKVSDGKLKYFLKTELTKFPEDHSVKHIVDFGFKYADFKCSRDLVNYYYRIRKILIETNDKARIPYIDILITWEKGLCYKMTPKEHVRHLKKYYDMYMEKEMYKPALQTIWFMAEVQHFAVNQIESLKLLYEAKKMANSNGIGDAFVMQRVYHNIGLMFYQAHLYPQAIENIKIAMATEYNGYHDSIISYNVLGLSAMKLNQYPSAEIAFSQCIEVALKAKDSNFYAVVIGNLAVVKYNLKKYDEAYKLLDYDKIQSFKHNIWGSGMNALTLQLQIKCLQQDKKQAKILMDSVNMLTPLVKDDNTTKSSIAEATLDYAELTKNYQLALSAQKQSTYYNNLALRSNKPNEISLWQLKASLNYSEAENDRAKAKTKARTLLLGTIICSLIIITVITVLWIQNRSRSIQARSAVLEKENELLELKDQKQLLDIADLNQQLHILLIEIKQSNFTIEEQKKPKRNELLEGSFDVIAFKDNESPEIVHLKKNKLATQESWLQFKDVFNKMYPSFETNLSKLHTDGFSDSEIRLMMLHQLGMNTEEISNILCISSDSVKKSRHRLYKKLDISTIPTLNNLIHQLCLLK